MKTLLIFLSVCFLVVFLQCKKTTASKTIPTQQIGLILASDSYSENDPANIYVSKPDGTACYLTHDGNANRNATWSYDGTKIAYVTGNLPALWTMDANGENKKQITFPPAKAFGPAFSPDGNQIVYFDFGIGEVANGLEGIEVWIMNADGSGQKQLTKTTTKGLTRTGINIRWSLRPMFSPDGKKILYASTQSGRTEIWEMNADGTNPRQLTFPGFPTAPDANFPSYSPDGSKIAFLGGYETEYGDIWIMNSDGTNRTQLTKEPDGVSSDEPAWSPDGKSILFNSNRYDPNLKRRSNQTWVMNADGSNPRFLFSHLFGEGRMPWRNDPVYFGGPTFQCR